MHVDYNEKEHVLVYNYYRHTFLALLAQYPDFPSAEIKKILRYTAEAVKELHYKDWIHIGQLSPTTYCYEVRSLTRCRVIQDVKPDNILVDWEYDDEGQSKVQQAALGDFDLALKLVDEQPLRAPHAVGNVMWRSPEGQSGKGVAKASDIYSLGLVVSGTRSLLPSVPKVDYQRISDIEFLFTVHLRSRRWIHVDTG